MKKLVALIAMLVVSLLCFTACNTTPAGKADSFERAKTYLQNLYSQGEENTPSDYEVVRQIRINGHSFPITWEVEILTEGIEPDAIKVEKGSTHYKIDVPDETTIVIKYLLKGTISNREETVTKSFPRVVPQSIPARKPVEGVEYNMAMVQFGIRKALYFNGQTESASVNYRLAMSESVADAVSVYIENHAEVEGAFYIYFIDANGTKTYIETYEREAGKGSLQLVTETPANYYVWNDALKLPIHVNADGSNSYYMGTYSTYKTISISNTSYILNSDGTPKNLDTTQFPARFFEPGTDLSGLLICEHKWQEATCTEPKTCPLCKETEGEALGHKGGTATCTEKAICEVCAEYYGELLEHNFVDGKCSVCGEPASDTPVVVLSTVELTVGSIGLAADSYAAGTATVGDVAFEYIELGNYGNGIQMRNKTVASSLWNTTAIDISKIELVYNAAQANYSNSNALKFEFSNNADFSDAHVVYLSTVKGQTTAYTVEADATYKYVRMTNNITYAMYWDSITIYYTSTGSDTPAVCEHEGGTATCKELAVCTKCGEAYGELAAHSFVAGVCSVCGAKDPNYVAPEVSTWTVVTELKDGDQVLIGAPAYGKLLSMVKTGYYNVGVDYTADNFDNVTDNEIFVVTVNADGTYSFTSLSGKVLALAASYSSLNDTGVNKSWSLVDKGNGVYYLKNTGRNTYLEWYASMNNWSTYGTASSDLFEISFYAKKGGETPAVCEHEGGNATCKELAVCSKCGEAYGEYADHVADTRGYSYNAEGHWYDCVNCQNPATEVEAHSFVDGVCAWGEKDPNYVAPEVSTWTVVTELKDGDQVLIGAPAYGKLLSMVKTG
ncbi:MAG: RICIN domain-containing protein, partial [Clostridia bacterium]|nr:RICIN domain-containing protein [Clostridia bacterium]